MHSRHPPMYEIRPYQPGDEASIVETFNTVFGAMERDHFEPRTLDQWRYLFLDNPSGTRVVVGVKDGQVASQYASLPVRTLIKGEERIFGQIVDSMVHPEHRAGLKRPGLFVETGLAFYDEYHGPTKDLITYGLPVADAWRIGKRFLRYEVARTQAFLAMELGGVDPATPDDVEVLESFDEQARWLYDRCAGAWGGSTVRDAAHLNWRYTNNAFHDYTVWGVRDGDGILRGYAVYRKADWIVPDMGLLVDWLVPPDEPEVGERLLAAYLARAKADGASVAAAVLPDWSPWFLWIQDRGFQVHPSDYFMVAVQFHRRFDMDWLRRYWWYTLGDTDLV